MNSSFLILLLLAFLGSVAGLIGGIIFILSKRLARGLAHYAIPLAAGVLLATSFLDLLPHAVEEVGNSAFAIVLLVYVIFFVVEHFLFRLHHHDDDIDHHHSHVKSSVPLVLLGDTIHNFLDGAAIAAAFLIDPGLGLVAALATFLHETPHEIADFGILLSAGWKKKDAITANFFSALATFPGAILTYLLADRVEGLSATLVAVAAGLFLYIATTDFLPEVGRSKAHFSWKTFLAFIFGILLVAVSRIVLPEVGH